MEIKFKKEPHFTQCYGVYLKDRLVGVVQKDNDRSTTNPTGGMWVCEGLGRDGSFPKAGKTRKEAAENFINFYHIK